MQSEAGVCLLSHAWWLKCDRIDRLEGAILGVSTGITQISDASGQVRTVNHFLCLVES